jgi:hypothetical protein
MQLTHRMFGAALAALAVALASPLPAQAAPAPGQPSGPCSVVPTTPQSEQACEACRKPIYPPPNQPPLTPHQLATIEWSCGSPGAPNPVDVPLDSNGQ